MGRIRLCSLLSSVACLALGALAPLPAGPPAPELRELNQPPPPALELMPADGLPGYLELRAVDEEPVQPGAAPPAPVQAVARASTVKVYLGRVLPHRPRDWPSSA
jgi:hypothetical protein